MQAAKQAGKQAKKQATKQKSQAAKIVLPDMYVAAAAPDVDVKVSYTKNTCVFEGACVLE
jgi:hypothetical protein